MSGGQSDLDALRVQAEEIKDEIKAKRKECRDTTMQQVSQKKIRDFFDFFCDFLRELRLMILWTTFGPKNWAEKWTELWPRRVLKVLEGSGGCINYIGKSTKRKNVFVLREK